MKMFECVGCGAHQASNLDVPGSCSACGADLVPAYRDLDEVLSLDSWFDGSRAAPRTGRVLPTCPVNDNDACVPAPQAWPSRGALVLGAAAVAVALFLGAGVLAAGDMERCQRAHSFDTCFSTLNR